VEFLKLQRKIIAVHEAVQDSLFMSHNAFLDNALEAANKVDEGDMELLKLQLKIIAKDEQEGALLRSQLSPP
jgi:hypothetical protein